MPGADTGERYAGTAEKHYVEVHQEHNFIGVHMIILRLCQVGTSTYCIVYQYIFINVGRTSKIYTRSKVQNDYLLRKLTNLGNHGVSRAWWAEPHATLLGEGTFGPKPI